MLSNKTVWRCSNQVLFSLSLFFVPMYLFSMGPDADTNARVHHEGKDEEDTTEMRSSASTNRRWSEKDFLPPYSEKEIAIQERILRTQGEEVDRLHKDLARF